jgi:hypothetical protein
MTALSEAEAREFFSIFYRGEHHFPGKMKKWGEGWAMNQFAQLATFDSNDLTRLVLLAHDRCIRVAVEPLNCKYMRIAVWKRERVGSIFERHPTMEQAIEAFRGGRP